MISDPFDDLPDRLDVLIVGAGFSGIYQLHLLRKIGLSVKIVEAGEDIGGTWHWNCYPGARCDSEAQMYQLSIDGVWEDWEYSCKFPDFREIRQYFDHIDGKLGVRRDVYFNTRVVAAEFDETEHRWVVTTQRGNIIRPRFLNLCTGFASKPYIPNLTGLQSFGGICHHTGLWPQDGIDLRNKRIAVIGTGASGVQVIEESAKVATHVTVFQRTPNLALPMNQEVFDESKKKYLKERQSEAFKIRRMNSSGHDIPFYGRALSETTAEERERLYERLFAQGGFHVTKGGFRDLFSNNEFNDWVYGFWRDRVRERLRDPWLKEKLAPQRKPHPFGVKRVALEQAYFDAFNQDNVTLIDVNETPISDITLTGIRTTDGLEHEFDIIVLATGFDGVTGGITQIDIKGTSGISIKEKWTTGVETNLGMTSHGFPNMFFVYAAHGVTALGNGPTCLEQQSEWVVRCIKYMNDNKLTRIEPTKEAETVWTKRNAEICSQGLWLLANGWYTGANIPGKRVECLSFPGGLALYTQICDEAANDGYKGFAASSTATQDWVATKL